MFPSQQERRTVGFIPLFLEDVFCHSLSLSAVVRRFAHFCGWFLHQGFSTQINYRRGRIMMCTLYFRLFSMSVWLNAPPSKHAS